MINNPAELVVRRFWVPAQADNSGAGLWGAVGNYGGVWLSVTNDNGYIVFKVPYDFNNIVSALAYVVPFETQAAVDIDLHSNYASVGEAYNTHGEAEVGATYNFTQDQIAAIDVSIVLTALAVGDVVGLRLLLALGGAGNGRFRLLGLEFQYE